ncbi:hypothetical protein [Clostridium perfringens]|uniref:hypothetical protein n=1 Tax=Clostridium perfringens TaxID=1502 RepID=UPI0024BC908B|nr:hypothetical protein [Clostridium perfringens]
MRKLVSLLLSIGILSGAFISCGTNNQKEVSDNENSSNILVRKRIIKKKLKMIIMIKRNQRIQKMILKQKKKKNLQKIKKLLL